MLKVSTIHGNFIFEDDDGNRYLSVDEFYKRYQRVNGEVICEICNLPYHKHPDETRFLDFNGDPYTKRLCDGIIGKL